MHFPERKKSLIYKISYLFIYWLSTLLITSLLVILVNTLLVYLVDNYLVDYKHNGAIFGYSILAAIYTVPIFSVISLFSFFSFIKKSNKTNYYFKNLGVQAFLSWFSAFYFVYIGY